MVTFVCEYCDLTLKKKQCDKHVMGRCRPAALICIDCSQTFRGNDYKSHISCISEMDKHWGQYAPSKKNNNSQQQSKPQQPKEQKLPSPKIQEQTEQQQKETNWKGWKNEIKRAIVEESAQQKKVELQSLKEKVLKRYHSEFEQMDNDEAVFMQKLQKLKKVKLVTYVSLE